MRSSFVLILLCSPLLAQFRDFSSTDDGRQLYFTTTLQQGSPPASLPEYRIFRSDSSGIALAVERGPLAAPNTFSSGFGARSPRVSGDGTVLGYMLFCVCSSPPCTSGGSEAVIQTPNAKLTFDNISSLALSHDAHWATLTTFTAAPFGDALPHSILLNVDTGERMQLPGPIAATFPVAKDGSVLVSVPSGNIIQTGLWKQGNFTPIPLQGSFGVFALSDDAQLLVYGQVANATSNPTGRLIVRNIASGNETLIISRAVSAGPVIVLGLSTDGSKLLYIVADPSNSGTAYLANTATGQSSMVSLPAGEAVVAGTLSGNGNKAFLLSTTGRVASVDIADGNGVTTLIPPTPFVPDFPILVPGSRVVLHGILPPLAALKGHLFLNDIALPVLGDSVDAVQVPWETTPGSAAFRLGVATDSPFHQNELVNVLRMFPRFLPLGPGQSSVFGFIAIRQDFSGLITTQPKPGDVIVAYMIGLGPVTSIIATGQQAPIDRLLPIAGTFRCHFNPYANDADTLFAGLAPSLIGFYQVNMRLPTESDPGPITGGVCTYSGVGVDGGFSFTLTTGAT